MCEREPGRETFPSEKGSKRGDAKPPRLTRKRGQKTVSEEADRSRPSFPPSRRVTDSEEYQQGTAQPGPARPGPRPLDWGREPTRPPPPSRGILAGATSLQMLRPPPYLVVGLGPGEASYVTVFPTATVRWEAAPVGTRLPAQLLAAALHLAGSDSNHLETNHRPSQSCFIAPETQPGAFANHRPERHSGAGTARPWPEAGLASPVVRRRRSRRRRATSFAAERQGTPEAEAEDDAPSFS